MNENQTPAEFDSPPEPPLSARSIDPKKTHKIAEFKHGAPLTTLRVDPTARFVAAGAQDLDVQLWNLETEQLRTLKGHKSWVRSIDFSADGERMLTACWGGVIHVWNTAEEEPKPLLTIKAHQGSARWVRLSPSGEQLATCGNDLLVKLWNLADGKLIQQFEGHTRHVYGVDFHPDGKELVSQDLMGQIKIWDIAQGKEIRAIDASVMTGYDNKFAADMGGARDLQFHPSGDQWASSGITKVSNSFAGIQSPIIVLFDWKEAKEQQQLTVDKNFKGIAWGVRYHPSGFIIGAGAQQTGKGELWFFEPDKPTPFHTVKLDSGARALDLLADQRRLAVAHANGLVRLYQMTS